VQGPIGPLAENPAGAWAEAVQVNLIGVMHGCRAVLPRMIARRSGKIVALSGEGASSLRPNFSAYAAAKAGLVRFVETVAEEIREHNVQINAIYPGAAYTHMTDQILDAGERAGSKALQAALEARTTGGVPPEKQIQLALFLASDRSNHVSGKLIHINDDWKRLENSNLAPDLYTLRRVQRG
jgi:3-oxoacyl-[acyl-carrier protein] reductase